MALADTSAISSVLPVKSAAMSLRCLDILRLSFFTAGSYRCILDTDKNGLTALDHAVKHFGNNASKHDIIRLLCDRGAVPSVDHSEAKYFYRNASNYVQNLCKTHNMHDSDRQDAGQGRAAAVMRVPELNNSGPIKHHLFMSHAQAISQTPVFQIVQNFEELTNNAIDIWTDQVRWQPMHAPSCFRVITLLFLSRLQCLTYTC